MLENIRSTIILKKIFKLVDDGIKLKIIHYNKRLQNKINITILNYQIFSGKYILYEENGRIKEYNSYNNKLLFEGEYSNRKRNGKGKEYYNKGNLAYEGEFSNGKEMEKEKNIMKKENLFLKGLIYMIGK